MSWEGRSGSSMATTKALWAREAHLWPSETPRAAPHQNKERSLQDTPSRPHCFPTCAHTRGHTHIHTYTLSWGPVITGLAFQEKGRKTLGHRDGEWSFEGPAKELTGTRPDCPSPGLKPQPSASHSSVVLVSSQEQAGDRALQAAVAWAPQEGARRSWRLDESALGTQRV